jgi:hypothetical protein
LASFAVKSFDFRPAARGTCRKALQFDFAGFMQPGNFRKGTTLAKNGHDNHDKIGNEAVPERDKLTKSLSYAPPQRRVSCCT